MALIAFDIDGTLIEQWEFEPGKFEDVPRPEVTDILWLLHKKGHDIIVWSGGGKEYAERWGRKLSLPQDVTYMMKVASPDIDIAIDDQDVKLAKVNLKV